VIGLIASREFRVRLRDRGFLISTLITMGVIGFFVLIRASGAGGTSSYDLGVAGAASDPIARAAVEVGGQQDVEVTVVRFADADAAFAAVRDGRVDAAVVDGRELVVDDRVPEQLGLVVEAGAVGTSIREALEDAGYDEAAIRELTDASPIPVRYLRAPDPDRDTNASVAFIAVLLLYGQLFGYGIWVATGVIEEKASRIVEILLATVPSRSLLAGKILGIGTLGLCQLFLIAAYAIGLATVIGVLEVPVQAAGTAALVLGWFVLGFAFYACLFAVAGSLVSRMEELQNVIVPINLLILASFFVSINAVRDPDEGVGVLASFLPFSSSLAMPVRIALGAAPLWQIALSLLILVGTIAALIPLAGRLYAGAVLQIGARVKLRDAWRGVEAS
jgi:ABC-2 type transport system permease protein